MVENAGFGCFMWDLLVMMKRAPSPVLIVVIGRLGLVSGDRASLALTLLLTEAAWSVLVDARLPHPLQQGRHDGRTFPRKPKAENSDWISSHFVAA